MNTTMNYVGRFISGVKTFYSEINPATLTGAIDVIVVQQPDGSLVCSPFHVRFGKMGVLRSREKIVDIQINGEPVDLFMKLGESGEAFFVEEMEEEDHVPEHLATSPIPTSNTLFEEGMKELHSQRTRHSRSETESSRESESASKTISSSSLRSSASLVPSKETGVDMQSVGEKLADISLEASGSGKAKEKKLTKTKNTLKTLQDVEAGSSQEEDSKLEERLGQGSSPHAKESVAIESETKTSGNSRSRIRAKRRRRKSGKGGKSEKTPPQNNSVRRVATMSESSTSSSHHSDEEELEGIFPIEDVEGGEGLDEDDGEVDHSARLISDERVPQAEWSNLATPTQRPFHVFSDGDYTPIVSPQATRPSTPKSDTEADHLRQSNLRQANKAAGVDKFEWNWGELPEQPSDSKRTDTQPTTSSSQSTSQGGKAEERKASIWSKIFSSKNQDPKEGGMYLQDLASEEVDPEVYALYFPESSTQVPGNRIRAIQEVKDEDKSSDLGNSLPQSPNTVGMSDSESHHSNTDSHHSASDLHHGMDSRQGCDDPTENLRGMELSLCGGLKEDEETIELDHFKKHLITYEEFIKDPSMLTNPKLVIRINNKFFNWQMAGPVIISQLAFQKPLPVDVASNLMKENIPKGRKSLTSWFWGSSPKPSTPKKEHSADTFQDDILIQQNEDERTLQRKDSMESGPNSADELEMTGDENALRRKIGTERYKKAIRLSSEQLAKLNLQHGANEIRYSVTTRYQGTCVCECTIYYWKYNTKIIISDIDGTITKSDVFGQILPVLGKDWTHLGVAQLYSNIKLNGYSFLYLSSRAIGQARLTKGYLNSIQQDKASLPDGPLLLNPSSLFRAFHSEVIVRKPEEFKIKCLKDIESLFPANIKPFYAGYGNRINDTWAYRAVGIPVSRIFTINPQGKLTHEMTNSFQSSYPRMKDLVDHVFPPLHQKTRMAFEAPAEYSSFTYWREPLPNLAPDDDLLTLP